MTLTYERRRARVAIVLAAVAIGLISCAATTSGAYQPSGMSLRPYRTYAWGPAETRSTGDPRLDNNDIFDRRVRMRIERRLAGHGFEIVAADRGPGLLVHYHASVSQQIDIRRLDVPADPAHDNQDAAQTVYEQGTLVVDLVDALSRQLVWRGWVEGRIDHVPDDQRQMERVVDEAVDAIFKRLPAGVSF